MSIIDKVKNTFNAFNRRAPTENRLSNVSGYVSSFKPDYRPLSASNARNIKAAIYNRIAADVSQVKMQVVRMDEKGNYKETITDSGLNTILTVEANKDQSSREFIRDMILSLLDEGTVAVCPIDTDDEVYNREVHDYEIVTMFMMTELDNIKK